GIRDGHLAANALEQSPLARIRSSLELLFDLAIDESINAADEKAGDAGNVADVLAFGSPGFQRGKKCFGHLFVSGLRKEQRDIDVDAVFECLANGRKAF